MSQGWIPRRGPTAKTVCLFVCFLLRIFWALVHTGRLANLIDFLKLLCYTVGILLARKPVKTTRAWVVCSRFVSGL